jgi:flavin reductase (DIM6/NTAB) family NADH-FMN oxidoreductase RutF
MPLADHDVGPFPVGRDPGEYDRSRRRVLWALPTGLYVVGSRSGADRNLMTCNWVMQVATQPKLVSLAVEHGSVTRRLIEDGGAFSVSLLPRSARAVVRRFVKPVESVELDSAGVATSMQGEPVREVTGGLPCLSVARSWLACEVRHLLTWDGDLDHGVASHVLFVGEVVDVGEGAPGGGVEEVAPGGKGTDGADGAEGPDGAEGVRNESAGGPHPDDDPGVLRTEDTRMNYGG